MRKRKPSCKLGHPPKSTSNKVNFKALIKSWLVKLGIYGLLPASFVTWVIQFGGLEHE
jgi:hypothetical protein